MIMDHLLLQKKYCQNLWNDVNFEIPTWNGYFGGFIEGPQVVIQKNLSGSIQFIDINFKKKYPLYLFMVV